ncbi:hypothetical protein CL684_02750 [Candidatus Campbellbacteria bacterium]|nr:hypothetical protein [Candidatus Campbellbacteria bacterium]|tara:strand:+ start:1436 stop:2335 length:900 start_codon:yes stop_codon:yes gene_type:complete
MDSTPTFQKVYISDVNNISGQTKKRKIWVPNEPMKEIHYEILNWFKKQEIILPSAAGGLPGNSPKRNLMRHKRQTKSSHKPFYPRYWFMTDISNAYGNVKLDLLIEATREYFIEIIEEEMIEQFFLRYCMSEDGGLVVGAPLSPLLFNIYCEKKIDESLRKYCDMHSITYSRYLDDLTFSSEFPIGRKKRKKLLNIVREGEFQINIKKTHLGDLHKKAIEINGIGLRKTSSSYVIFTPRHYLSHIRGLLNLVLKEKTNISPQIIHGKMGLFLSVSKGRKLNRTEQKVLELYQEFKTKIK